VPIAPRNGEPFPPRRRHILLRGPEESCKADPHTDVGRGRRTRRRIEQSDKMAPTEAQKVALSALPRGAMVKRAVCTHEEGDHCQPPLSERDDRALAVLW
jgi:hypothetical protein